MYRGNEPTRWLDNIPCVSRDTLRTALALAFADSMTYLFLRHVIYKPLFMTNSAELVYGHSFGQAV